MMPKGQVFGDYSPFKGAYLNRDANADTWSLLRYISSLVYVVVFS